MVPGSAHADTGTFDGAYAYERDPVILGLTRPAMIAGVGWDWMFANLMVAALSLLLTAHPVSLLAFPIGHAIGVGVYALDPHGVGLIATRLKVGLRANRALWSGNSYGG